MGTVISKAANGLGGLLGNAFAAPFKSVFGATCEDVCAGTWDITCFIEHLCVSNLVKLLMVLGLCYLTFLFFYLLFKLGICQCIGRSLCKMCWAACETYWFALENCTCFLWHKLKNVKRVNRRRRRRRFQDVEVGYSSSGDSTSFDDDPSLANNGRYIKLERHRRKNRLRSSPYCSRLGYKDGRAKYNNHHHHRSRSSTRQMSLHLKDRSERLRNLRQLQIQKASNLRREATLCKRRLR